MENINFKIKGGTVAAFVGHGGAGKSTILNFLPRFYAPQKDQLRLMARTSLYYYLRLEKIYL